MRKAAAAGLVLLALVLTGCQDNTSTGTSGFPIGNGAANQIPVAKRGEPVALSGPTLSGGTLNLASLRGQVVVLNVWGSWCAPCRKEARSLVDAQQQLNASSGSASSGSAGSDAAAASPAASPPATAPPGASPAAPSAASGTTLPAGTKVAFVGINTRDDYPAQAVAFEKNYGITYPSLVDDGGNLLLALRGAVPPKAIPTTLVLDPQGRIAARFLGGITATTLVDLVQDVVSSGSGTSS